MWEGRRRDLFHTLLILSLVVGRRRRSIRLLWRSILLLLFCIYLVLISPCFSLHILLCYFALLFIPQQRRNAGCIPPQQLTHPRNLLAHRGYIVRFEDETYGKVGSVQCYNPACGHYRFCHGVVNLSCCD